MIRLVVDANVAVKWVIEESGTEAALKLRRFELHAPDLLLVECANVLWKKARRRELSGDEAELAAALLVHAHVELHSARTLIRRASQIAGLLDHAVYDCVYLALAENLGCAMVTADEKFCNKLPAEFAVNAITLRNSESTLSDA